MDILRWFKAFTEQRVLAFFVFIFLIVMINLADPVLAPQESIDSMVNKSALMVILDTSLSMDRVDSNNRSRLVRATDAISSLLGRAKPEHVLSLRTFSTFSTLVIPPSPGKNIDVAEKLDDIEVLASSDIGKALRAAREDIEKFRKETENTIPWTCILITDGKGDDSDSDVANAREFSDLCSSSRCHVIGIDVPSSQGEQLRLLASVMDGNCWIPEPGEFSAAFDAAAYLAGFKSATPLDEKLFFPDSKTNYIPVLAIVISALLAMALRTRVSEGTFLVFLSIFAAILAWASWMYLLPEFKNPDLKLLDLVDFEHAVRFLILKNIGRVAIYFMIVGVIFGAVLTASESLYIASWKRAVKKAVAVFPLAMWGGILAGALAQLLFVIVRGCTYVAFSAAFGDDAIPDKYSLFFSIRELTNVLSRSFGWGLAGAVIGACPGFAASSAKKIKNGMIGGICGGIIGGYFFENNYTQALGGDGIRLLALTATSIAIAIMIRVVEEYRKVAWLVIEEGGPTGKSFIIDKAETILGSHYKCDVVVRKMAGISARAEADLTTDGKAYTIRPSKGGQVTVNGQVVAAHILAQGDEIEVAAGKLSFHSRIVAGSETSTSISDDSALSHIEEDLVLPKTHNSKQKSVDLNKDDNTV